MTKTAKHAYSSLEVGSGEITYVKPGYTKYLTLGFLHHDEHFPYLIGKALYTSTRSVMSPNLWDLHLMTSCNDEFRERVVRIYI